MAAPALPPYGHLDREAVQCIAQASSRYEVPELLLHALLGKEDGRGGQCVRNKNGTYDCGLAQINTSWTGELAKYGVSMYAVATDACTNISVAAYILKKNYYRKDLDWRQALVAYNIGPNNWTPARYQVGVRYANDVIRRWWSFHGWLQAQPARKPEQ